MDQQETPRDLRELTGRHYCVQCLALVDCAVYLANHFLCTACAEKGAEFPLATTPDAKPAGENR